MLCWPLIGLIVQLGLWRFGLLRLGLRILGLRQTRVRAKFRPRFLTSMHQYYCRPQCIMCKFVNSQLCSSREQQRSLINVHAMTYIHCEASPPNLNSTNAFLHSVGGKPSNLKTTNISCYTVHKLKYCFTQIQYRATFSVINYKDGACTGSSEVPMSTIQVINIHANCT